MPRTGCSGLLGSPLLGAQPGKMVAAFRYSCLQIHAHIEISRLCPEVDCLLGSAKRFVQYRERSNRVRQIERSGAVMTAIDREGLSVARLRQFETRFILMDVAEMSNCVSQPQSVASVSADPDRFLIEWERGIPATEIAFDLTQALERTNQACRATRTPTGGNRLREVPTRVGRTPGTARSVAPRDEKPSQECHRVPRLQLVCLTPWN